MPTKIVRSEALYSTIRIAACFTGAGPLFKFAKASPALLSSNKLDAFSYGIGHADEAKAAGFGSGANVNMTLTNLADAGKVPDDGQMLVEGFALSPGPLLTPVTKTNSDTILTVTPTSHYYAPEFVPVEAGSGLYGVAGSLRGWLLRMISRSFYACWKYGPTGTENLLPGPESLPSHSAIDDGHGIARGSVYKLREKVLWSNKGDGQNLRFSMVLQDDVLNPVFAVPATAPAGDAGKAFAAIYEQIGLTYDGAHEPADPIVVMDIRVLAYGMREALETKSA